MWKLKSERNHHNVGCIKSISGQNLSGNIEGSVLSGIQCPFDQSKTTVFDLDTGDAAWMHTAAGISVRGIFRIQHGAVCMTTDQRDALLFCKVSQPPFYFFLTGIVFGGAGGIQHAKVFQWLPDIADQKTGKPPERRI